MTKIKTFETTRMGIFRTPSWKYHEPEYIKFPYLYVELLELKTIIEDQLVKKSGDLRVTVNQNKSFQISQSEWIKTFQQSRSRILLYTATTHLGFIMFISLFSRWVTVVSSNRSWPDTRQYCVRHESAKVELIFFSYSNNF